MLASETSLKSIGLVGFGTICMTLFKMRSSAYFGFIFKMLRTLR